MMTKKEKKRVPELRFEGFEGEWESTKLKKIFSRSTKKNSDNISCVLTNSASQGIVSQDSYFDRDIANPNNLEGYYVVELNDFVYNPRISNLAPVGPLKRNRLKKGVMSPLYTVLRPIKGDLNYLESYFESNNWHYYMKSVANYGARFDRMNITISEFENLPVIHPSLSEQQKIATFLTSIDTRLQQLEKKKTLLEEYKKGVMQRIFKQEIRFNDQDGKEFPKWEKRRLGDVAKFSRGKGISKSDIEEQGVNECIRYGELYTTYNEIIDSIVSKTNVSLKGSVISKSNDVIIPSSGETHLDIATASCVLKDGVILGGDLNIIRTKLNGVFLAYLLNSSMKKDIASLAQGNSVVHLYNKELSTLNLELPCLSEQTKIAHFLSALDRKIAVVDEQIEKTKEWKKGMLQKMFV